MPSHPKLAHVAPLIGTTKYMTDVAVQISSDFCTLFFLLINSNIIKSSSNIINNKYLPKYSSTQPSSQKKFQTASLPSSYEWFSTDSVNYYPGIQDSKFVMISSTFPVRYLLCFDEANLNYILTYCYHKFVIPPPWDLYFLIFSFSFLVLEYYLFSNPL